MTRGLNLAHFFLSILLLRESFCLKNLRVSVPHYTHRGGSALLECKYDLEGDFLYSITWHKDQDEFYKYVPRNKPPQQVFYSEGFRVDHHMSDHQQVVLRNVNLKASGTYKCEVSAEAPAFTSKSGEAHMEVIYHDGKSQLRTGINPRLFQSDNRGLRLIGLLNCGCLSDWTKQLGPHVLNGPLSNKTLPETDPEITGEDKIYQVGDEVNLNCTSDKSYPPARLKWYVNNQQVLADYEAMVHHHGLISSIIGLKFEAMPQHFHNGKMEVKCVSTIITDRDVVMERTTPLFDNREALFLVMGGATIMECSAFTVIMMTVFVLLNT